MKTELLKNVRRILIGFLVILLQTSFVRQISIKGITPDFLLLFVFIVAIKEGAFVGTLTGFIMGLCLDVYSPEVLGTGALAMTVVGFLVGLVNEKTIRMEGKMQISFMFVSTVFHGILLHVFIHGTNSSLLSVVLFPIVPTAVYTSLCGSVLMLIREMRS